MKAQVSTCLNLDNKHTFFTCRTILEKDIFKRHKPLFAYAFKMKPLKPFISKDAKDEICLHSFKETTLMKYCISQEKFVTVSL